MFIRGTGFSQEFDRKDQGFYRGIVVKNNDPLKLNRVKIYISELSNQPFDEWFADNDSIEVKAPGKNTEPFKDKIDNWSDVKIYDEIANNIPWAEPCYPILGESSNFKYYKDGEIKTISDANFKDGFEVINANAPSLSAGSFAPAFLYEINDTALGDAFSQPLGNFSVNNNPYSFQYTPSKESNNAKGVFGIPDVGSKVWVFHYQGDLNFPVYFGSSHDGREIININTIQGDGKVSQSYPNDFES